MNSYKTSMRHQLKLLPKLKRKRKKSNHN